MLWDIIQSWSRLLLKSSPGEKELAKARLEICEKCEFRLKVGDFGICKKCGCIIPAKVFSKESTCPEKFWDSTI